MSRTRHFTAAAAAAAAAHVGIIARETGLRLSDRFAV